AKANLQEYFSGPNYFLAGLTMFASLSVCGHLLTTPTVIRVDRRWFVTLILVAIAVTVLDSESPRLSLPSAVDRAVFRDLIFDGRLSWDFPSCFGYGGADGPLFPSCASAWLFLQLLS
ncbi:MAG: hypothetical protein ACO31D_07380, partial [Ilumatobacteraceae bacterium]